MVLGPYVDLPTLDPIELVSSSWFDNLIVHAHDESSGIAYLRFASMEPGQVPGTYEWDYCCLDSLCTYEKYRDFTFAPFRPTDFYFQAVDGGGNLSETVFYHYEPSSDDPAASVSGFSVCDGHARWKVESEFETDHFRIEAASNARGPWIPVQDFVAPAAGARDVRLADGAEWFRLVEVENGGGERICGLARRQDRRVSAEAPMPPLETLQERVLALEGRREAGLAGEPPRWGEGDSLTVFCPEALLAACQYSLAAWWTWCGYGVEIATIDAFPDEPDSFRLHLKNEIASRASAGVKYFLLVGDANDWQSFDLQEQGSLFWVDAWESIHQDYLDSGYPPQGQAERDFIPTFVEADTLPRDMNLAWWTPYRLSDFPYSDTDGDGLPDVVVTRLPFDTEAELWAYGGKMQMNQEGADLGATRVSLFVGDVEYVEGHNNAALALASADSLAALLPGGVETSFLYQSEHPDPGDRNDAAAAQWNSFRPDLLVMFASLSNRSWPANFFDQTYWTHPWSMDMIHPYGTHAPLVLAASCGGSDFARTEDPDYGRPISHRFLEAWDKGAISWVGPSLGSWHAGNEEIAVAFVEELYSDPARPAAESFMIAQRRVLQEHPDRSDIVDTARSYVFMGDPVSRLARTRIPVEVPETPSDAPALKLEANYPNPFNPETCIVFELDRKCRMDLAIFDARGRRIRTFKHGVMNEGRYELHWDGKNDLEKRVASGVYFIRLESDGRILPRKIILIK